MSVFRECPDPSTLAMFAEGALPRAARAEVLRHLADCPECPLVVGEMVRFLRSESPGTPSTRGRGAWWASWLAAAITALCVSVLVWQILSGGDPLQRVKNLAAKSASRPVEGQLAGFAYAPFSRFRSGPGVDLNVRYRAEAEGLIESRKTDARSLHAAGIAFLLAGDSTTAAEILSAAARAAPENASIWNDLSVVYIEQATVGDKRRFQSALTAADHARTLEPAMAAAYFNRAVALEHLGQRDAALRDYRTCSSLEPRSSWGEEARRRTAFLQR